jgi:hypothetical protein
MTDAFTELVDAENLAIEGAQAPEWLARPYQLVSLPEMIQFNLRLFYITTLLLSTNEILSGQHPLAAGALDGMTDESLKKQLSDTIEKRPQSVIMALQKTLRRCNELGLEFSAGYTEQKIKELEQSFSPEKAESVL